MMCYKVTPEKTFEARTIFPSFPKQSPARYADLAVACMSPDPNKRPSMDVVVSVITSMLKSIQNGKEFEAL